MTSHQDEDQDRMRAVLEPLYQQMAEAFAAQDAGGILELLAPDYLLKIGAQVLFREQVQAGLLHDLRRERSGSQSLHFDVEEASANGEDRATAVVRITQTREDKDSTLRRADSWVRAEAGWRLQVSLAL